MTILIFILVLGLLVLVHELGHFVAAKKSGMKVEEFGFGFPPRLFGLQKTQEGYKIIWGHAPPADSERTVYSINWIPFGGFVKIMGENNENTGDPRSFVNRPFFSRLLVLVAGVFMNVVLAWILTSIGLVIGLPAAVDGVEQLPRGARLENPQVAIIEVVEGYPAAKAGIKPGDVILSLDGRSLNAIEEVSGYIKGNAGKVIDFGLKRNAKELTVSVETLADPEPGQGPTGISLASLGKLTVPWYLAPWEGLKTTFIQLSNILTAFYRLISQGLGLSSLGGPVKIAQLTGEVAQMGFIYLLQFTSFLSLNLAILNILPFPALDGGRVLFLLIEKARGRKNNQRLEQLLNTAGFLLLLMLMAVVTVKDVSSLGGLGRIFSKLFGG